jgi:predicted Fe-S protein YdhL (DUF1289 family)
MIPPIDPAPSPCVRNCTLDDKEMCVGCGRMLGEILEWSNASLARKLEIRAALPARLAQRPRW